MPRLFCFGLGYTARAVARAVRSDGWQVAGTCRSAESAAALAADGVEAVVWDGERPLAPERLTGATHLLSSVPPGAAGDPVLACHRADIAAMRGMTWAGYLSATSVYGDQGGAAVDESAPLRPAGERGRRRAEAEAAWLALWRQDEVPVHVFRLAGIYGPGRSALDQVRAGTARRIDSGQAFSRIHIDDIVAVLRASMARPRPGAVYNVCDDRPAPSAEVVAFACRLLGAAPPPLVPLAEAGLSPAARAFYDDDKRPSNARIKTELGVRLAYPDYESGLRAILAGA